VSLPYRWQPLAAGYTSFRNLKPGDIVPYDHAVYRVVETRVREDHPERPNVVTLRPIEVVADDPRSRDHDRHIGTIPYFTWYTYPDLHYPICSTCSEPLPCREQMAVDLSEQAAERFERFTLAGVCPACSEPVSQRQKSMTWEDNAVVPGGPPVTFHLRRACRESARRYEMQWVALDPNRRRHVLTCQGSLTVHYSGERDCTELAECPGSFARHPLVTRHYPGHSTCYCVAGDLKSAS
jgi:hypothetical protein